MTLQGPIVVTGAGGFVGRALVARLGVPHDAPLEPLAPPPGADEAKEST